jgi:diguanylate cyclase (GGDEF)-like protein
MMSLLAFAHERLSVNRERGRIWRFSRGRWLMPGSRLYRKGVLLLLSALFFSVLLIVTDATDYFFAFSRAHETWELDEIVMSVAVVFSLHFAAFEALRWREYRRLYESASTDSLTSLRNRRGVRSILESEAVRSRRYQRPLALIMVDIDNFKKINDRFGHQTGDDALKRFAKLLLHGTRETDLIGRWGGEEFVIVAVETDAHGAGCLAEKLRKKIESTPFRHVWRTTASFGIAVFHSPESINDLISRADRALYEAKASGKNRVVSF